MRIFTYTIGLLLFISCIATKAKSLDSWTWLFKKKFTKQQKAENAKKTTITFEKKSVPNFSQLVFSWNAFRPKEGHFSFFAKVRDAKTKQWGQWHKMIDWGRNIQRSYFSSRDKTKYIYVRLETEKLNLADGFLVKIVSAKKNQMANIKGFSVCTSNFNLFKPEDRKKSFAGLPSVCIKKVPRYSQMILNHERAAHMCSPTSCSMLTGFLTKKAIDPIDFANHVFDGGLDTYGSWPLNMAHAFELCEGKQFFSVARLPSFDQLHKFLRKKIPVVVSVRGSLPGAPKTYDKGHLLLVAGWDAKRKQVLCHDSAMDRNRSVFKRYDIEHFLSAWERSRRLAYIAEPVS